MLCVWDAEYPHSVSATLIRSKLVSGHLFSVGICVGPEKTATATHTQHQLQSHLQWGKSPAASTTFWHLILLVWQKKAWLG